MQRIEEAFDILVPVADPALVLAPGQVALWTEGGPRVAERLMTSAALPEGRDFAVLIDERWGSDVDAEVKAETDAEAEAEAKAEAKLEPEPEREPEPEPELEPETVAEAAQPAKAGPAEGA